MSRSKQTNAILFSSELKPKPYPLIELMGYRDTGKFLIGQSVARKLQGTVLQFPIFPRGSVTGIGLSFLLGQNTRLLEMNPQWWSLMYAANLWENVDRVKENLKIGPVVVVNWTTAARIYHKTLTNAPATDQVGLYRGLPEADFKFVIKGQTHSFPGNFAVQFTPSFERSLNSAFTHYPNAVHMSVEYTGNPTNVVNQVAQEIVNSILRKRPDLKEKDFKYESGTFSL